MDTSSVTVKGPDGDRRIPARTKIWAAGVQASPLAAMLAQATGAGTDRAGRVAVRPDCSLPGHPEVFAIGDMAALNDLPGVAQPAIQQGSYVGRLIARPAGRQDRHEAFRVPRQGQHGHYRPPIGRHGLATG